MLPHLVNLILAEKSGVDKKVYFCYSLISPADEGKQSKRVFLTNNECRDPKFCSLWRADGNPPGRFSGEHFLFKPQGRTIFLALKERRGRSKEIFQKINEWCNEKIKKRVAAEQGKEKEDKKKEAIIF